MTTPDPSQGIFSWVAYILFQMRTSLEERQDGALPRWVRIARGGSHQAEGGKIGEYVGKAVEAVLSAFPFLHELALDLEEILYQADAAAALGQVVLDGLNAAFDERTRDGLDAFFGAGNTPSGLTEAFTAIDNVSGTASQALDYVPSPEDVWIIGNELYRLLCVVQKRQADELDEHVDLANSGKLRFCVWSYGRSLSVRDVTEGRDNAPEPPNEDIGSFGSRRLHDDPLATRVSAAWPSGDGDVLLYRHDFEALAADANKRTDLQELIGLLRARGFGRGDTPAGKPLAASPDISTKTTIDDEFAKVLRQFQAINELPITGEVDNHTINRLLNLDFARKNVRRARPYDPAFPFPASVGIPGKTSGRLELINPGADDFADEGVAAIGSPYTYYEVRPLPQITSFPRGQGWIADGPGFVALQTRARASAATTSGFPADGRLQGGRWTEGAAVTGRYFWAARHTEPWKAGRQGEPGPGALFGGTRPAPGAVTRMYQWMPLASVLGSPPAGSGWTLTLQVSAQQTSLFSDRGLNGVPDQGRVLLEVYDGEANTKRTRTGAPLGRVELEPFPDRTDVPALPDPDSYPITVIDARRRWYYRISKPLTVPSTATLACVVLEGIYQSAYDIDAYFDDVEVTFTWVQA